MTDEIPEIDLAPLSKRARALAGAWFGMMRPGHGDVTHHLREWEPTLETRLALTELMEAGVISETPFNRYGGLVYRPLVSCWPAMIWMRENIDDPELKFQLMQPVKK